MIRALFPLVSAVALAWPAAAGAQDTMTEPGSGVAFPLRLSAPAGGEQVLTGAGLRTKTFLQVKVYAFGLYVDSAGAVAALAPHAGKDRKALQNDQAFYDDLLKLQFPMTLRLVMTRNVGGEDMAEAFDGALRPRVQRAAAERGMPGGEEALTTFRGYFSVGEMTKEAELLFSCTPDGTLSSRVKGQDQPAIVSPALCWALFDVYLGPDPISGGGKKSAVANFPALLGAGASR